MNDCKNNEFVMYKLLVSCYVFFSQLEDVFFQFPFFSSRTKVNFLKPRNSMNNC